MVTCSQCGKDGWLSDMKLSSGRFCCAECHAKVGSPVEQAAEVRDLPAEMRARLEFARYLVKRGHLNEAADEKESVSPFGEKPR